MYKRQGVDSAKHALEYIMLGASAVQVGTAVMTQGHSAIGTIVDELENWLDAHGLASVEQVRGKALANMKSFDEMKIEPAVSTVQSVPLSLIHIYVVLSGPSHAEEVGRKLPTTVATASRDLKAAEAIQDLFMTERFRVYTTDDVVGVELGGALKNIIALGAGAVSYTHLMKS